MWKDRERHMAGKRKLGNRIDKYREMLQQVGSSLSMQTVMSQQLECPHRSLLYFSKLSQGFCLDRVALIRSGLPKQRRLLACNQQTSTSFSSGLGKDKDNAHSSRHFWFQQGYFFGCLFGGPTYNRLWLKALHYLYCRSSIKHCQQVMIRGNNSKSVFAGGAIYDVIDCYPIPLRIQSSVIPSRSLQ